MRARYSRASFTLIELLITIGIVTVLSVVVVLTLNPAQLLRQARDSTRVSDIDAMNRALSLHQVDVSGGTYGTASTTYVSIPDSSATCANLSLPTLPTGYTYACATSANYKKVDGTGWIPVNLTQISSGSPLGVLPTDPVNTTSTGNYYTYMTGASWALASLLESDKFLKASALNDGGYDPGRYEKGSDLSLVAKNQGLKGWWDFEEGGGPTAVDRSDNGNNGTWFGIEAHYVAGKVGNWAGWFNNVTDDYVIVPYNSSLPTASDLTFQAWINPPVSSPQTVVAQGDGNDYASAYQIRLENNNSYFVLGTGISGIYIIPLPNISTDVWTHIAATVQGTAMKVYFNGVLVGTATFSGTRQSPSTSLKLGRRSDGYVFKGKMDDIRIHSRALSAAEVLAIYNATK